MLMSIHIISYYDTIYARFIQKKIMTIKSTLDLKMNPKKLTPWCKFEFAPYITFEKFQM